MGLLRGTAVVTLACALVASGFGPMDHLHPATHVHPAVAHAHPDTATATDHEASAAHDDHSDAVHIRRVMARGQTPQVAKPATTPAAAWLCEPEGAALIHRSPDLLPTGSPPGRPSAPRAPPA